MNYENTFYDGPLAGAILKTTVPLLAIAVVTERTRKVRGAPGVRKILPLGTHRYEFDYQEQVEDNLMHRRFCIEEDE